MAAEEFSQLAMHKILKDRIRHGAAAAAVHPQVEDQAIQMAKLIQGALDLFRDGLIEKGWDKNVTDLRAIRSRDKACVDRDTSLNGVAQKHDVMRRLTGRLHFYYDGRTFRPAQAIAELFVDGMTVDEQDAIVSLNASTFGS